MKSQIQTLTNIKPMEKNNPNGNEKDTSKSFPDFLIQGDQPLFWLGQTMITAAAYARLDHRCVLLSLCLHATGDWGIVSDQDKKSNDEAVGSFERIVSAYLDRNGVRFLIITEADRSATTILLPDDY